MTEKISDRRSKPASSKEKANGWAMRADERVSRYQEVLIHSALSAVLAPQFHDVMAHSAIQKISMNHYQQNQWESFARDFKIASLTSYARKDEMMNFSIIHSHNFALRVWVGGKFSSLYRRRIWFFSVCVMCSLSCSLQCLGFSQWIFFSRARTV